MNVQDWGKLSLGEWAAACHGWAKANGQNTLAPPSEADFDAAVRAARGGD